MRAIAAASRSRPASISAGPSTVNRLLGALEEDVGDLDLGGARASATPGRRSRAGSRSGRRARRARRRRGGRSCSRRPAAARPRARPGGRSSRAGRCRRRRAGAAPRPGPRRRRRRSARAAAPSRASRGPAPAAPRRRSASGRARRRGVPARQLRRGLAPPVRLAPLEQRVHGGAPGGPLLPRRGRRRALAERVALRSCWATKNASARAEAEHALHVEAVGALLVGGDRGVGEGAAGDDRRAGARPAAAGPRRAGARRRRRAASRAAPPRARARGG